jgi:fructosamine-3-kinase
MGHADAARRVERLLGVPVRECHAVGGQHGARHYRAVLADGRAAFVKAAEGGTGGAFTAEAQGLRWLGEAAAVPVPPVLGWDDSLLVLGWVTAETPDFPAAERFGRGLARLHTAGARCFGAPWPGFIAGLPLPNEPGGAWPDWYAAQRVLPFLRLAVDRGLMPARDAPVIEGAVARAGELMGAAEPPSRIHGDCWAGNVVWSGGQGWLVDPAAHGGHRETDLAMLALFGAPFLDRIMGAYQEAAPLAPGWRERIPLHQLHPLLVHVCLFGGSYRAAALAAARAVLVASA